MGAKFAAMPHRGRRRGTALTGTYTLKREASLMSGRTEESISGSLVAVL